MRKKRILMSNEASFSLTGYGTYGKAILSRLQKTNKYEIAEFASFAKIGDCRDEEINWLFYPNAVGSNDARFQEYDSSQSNKFGQWRFDQVCLDFKPDIVFDIRDPWMFSYEHLSPLRPYFNWTIMPTVDSAPQKNEWIETYIDADGVFTYSDYGLQVLRKEGGNRIKLQQAAFPGVDLEIFKPVADKKEHRRKMKFDEDAFIIGTIMRNQKRKLYPDLFKAFKLFLDSSYPEVANKTYLYVHTSYPDEGWDIPALLKEFNLGNKVLFTYICQTTGKPFVGFFQDAITYSPHSNAPTGVLPSTKKGLSLEQLSDVFNLFDIYVQYSICEGFGMPMAEAAACGVPVMAVDYSAMQDVVEKTKGIPIRPALLFKEFETEAYRAYPDNEYCAKAMKDFFNSFQTTRDKYGANARAAAEKYFNWDVTAKIWEKYFDSVELTGLQGKWDAPAKLHSPTFDAPTGMSHEEIIKWGFKNILGKPELATSLMGLNLLRDLNYGSIPIGTHKRIKFGEQQVFDLLYKMNQKSNFIEQCRCGIVKVNSELDYIKYAHRKHRIDNE